MLKAGIGQKFAEATRARAGVENPGVLRHQSLETFEREFRPEVTEIFGGVLVIFAGPLVVEGFEFVARACPVNGFGVRPGPRCIV